MRYMELPIESVELDINNPRIKQFLEIYGDNITSEGIALALSASSGVGSSTSHAALKESIKVNRGLINPIIVNHSTDTDKMTVIEGNTRLQIYKEFKESDPTGPWNTIIAIVYEDLTNEQIHAIRLQTHLVGPRDWDPYSKAKYLHQLSDIEKLPMNTIISYCGGKGPEIRKLIDAYICMDKYYIKPAEEMGFDPDVREFSKFAEFQNTSVKQSLIVHSYTEKDFATWVIKGNIDSAQNVRKIPAILANRRAKEEFLKTNISEAVKYLNADEKSSKILDSLTLDNLIVEVTTRIKRIEWSEIKGLRNNPSYSQQKENIIDLLDELSDLVKEIQED